MLAAVVAMAVVGAYVAFGSPGLYAKSESPEFCGSCHVLQPEYESWFHSGAHQNMKCIHCHLPNNNLANHLFWKSVEGIPRTPWLFIRAASPKPSASPNTAPRWWRLIAAAAMPNSWPGIDENRRCWD